MRLVPVNGSSQRWQLNFFVTVQSIRGYGGSKMQDLVEKKSTCEGNEVTGDEVK